MAGREFLGSILSRGMLALLAVLAAAVLIPMILVAIAVIIWYPGWYNVDAPIPAARARSALEAVLKDVWGVTLDPDAKVIAAHEQIGGGRGEGAEWFQVTLGPGRSRRFEEELLEHVKAEPRTRHVERVPAGSIGKTTNMPPWWKPGLPDDAHAWKIEGHSTAYAIFFDSGFCMYYIRN